ncbi:hypothetical protein PWEIH_09983 [Listeria weihenstephanensis FSL R9-0317]|uniref:AbiEi antitoxin C-terminal domain-containing protein n=1 Tax=Listeria weihenstephanensis TaxID=1006155 RepID=A0A1S7FS44_9LIST|nr:DUF6088 family protein [Listeria weihenstephanensis]AQY50189.1 hypothetical protein UE46_03480 [Listeria weihenstephanensis]EUJ38084.1 hypothetical protein PWEIH_09983 [Listeria weihenstephanensis FSL R9-0317]MBC1500700.1 hypothetical protein [Listeria weihenstephanensis]
MAMREILLDEYGYNEPIVTTNISERSFGLKLDSLRRNMNRLVEKKEMVRFSEGVYYFPKWNEVLQQNTQISEQVVIERKYIQDKRKRYGYLAGLALANQLQLTTQVPMVLEIVTENNASKKRTVIVKNTELTLKKSRVPITFENYKILQVLDLLTDKIAYNEVSKEVMTRKLISYLGDISLSAEQVIEIISKYPSKTSKELIETGLYHALIQGQRDI